MTQVEYELREELPAPEQLARLRERNDMAPRSMEGLRRGLPNSAFGVVVAAIGEGGRPGDSRTPDETGGSEPIVGTARIVGDGGSVYHICDMVVHPGHQRRGVGSLMMDALMDFIEETAPPNAYVNLLADVDGFYEQWGFELTAPASRGMFLRTD